MGMVSVHKRWMATIKDKTGMTDYSMVWWAFIKGLVVGLLVYHFFLTG